MANQERQVEGREEEASLAIVGSSLVDDPQQEEQIFISKKAEYQRYSELLKVFFEKLTRWHEIFITEGHNELRAFPWSWLRVKSSANGFVIDPDMEYEYPYPPDTILEAGYNNLNTSEIGNNYHYWFRPGEAGRNFFVDPDGKSLTQVRFHVMDKGNLAELSICVDELSPSPENISVLSGNASVVYQLNRQLQIITIDRSTPHHKLISEAYASHLFNTIDSLIPQANPQLPELTAEGEQ